VQRLLATPVTRGRGAQRACVIAIQEFRASTEQRSVCELSETPACVNLQTHAVTEHPGDRPVTLTLTLALQKCDLRMKKSLKGMRYDMIFTNKVAHVIRLSCDLESNEYNKALKLLFIKYFVASYTGYTVNAIFVF